VQVAYYDQQRERLDPAMTVFDTIGEGNDTVTVNGQSRHVHGYLRDFLFPPERARSPVGSLSGGERNRLVLARLFTRPANVLVLDEPTNDLDLETLELLEAQLVDWPGTLLLVSHDRAFLDDVVTSVYVFEGEGRVEEYVGGYSDWLRLRTSGAIGLDAAHERVAEPEARGSASSVADDKAAETLPAKKRLSYNEQREFERLPARIDELEVERQQLHAAITAPAFYKESSSVIARTLDRQREVEQLLLEAMARWDDLDSRAPRSAR
jgi:ATP-binding cassette subfamily F protein uup